MKSWAKWVNRSEASLVPGAKEFIDLARDIGIQLIFISNRMDKRLDATKKYEEFKYFSEDDIYIRLDRKDKKTIRRKRFSKDKIACLNMVHMMLLCILEMQWEILKRFL